jgi:pimeloyl-ACP methyl ester carboxylesterase
MRGGPPLGGQVGLILASATRVNNEGGDARWPSIGSTPFGRPPWHQKRPEVRGSATAPTFGSWGRRDVIPKTSDADRFARAMRPVIAEIHAAGVVGFGSIAAVLNE